MFFSAFLSAPDPPARLPNSTHPCCNTPQQNPSACNFAWRQANSGTPIRNKNGIKTPIKAPRALSQPGARPAASSRRRAARSGAGGPRLAPQPHPAAEGRRPRARSLLLPQPRPRASPSSSGGLRSAALPAGPHSAGPHSPAPTAAAAAILEAPPQCGRRARRRDPHRCRGNAARRCPSALAGAPPRPGYVTSGRGGRGFPRFCAPRGGEPCAARWKGGTAGTPSPSVHRARRAPALVLAGRNASWEV